MVDLIGVRMYEEYCFWKDFVDVGGDDLLVIFDGGIGFIYYLLIYDIEIVGKWMLCEKCKCG